MSLTGWTTVEVGDICEVYDGPHTTPTKTESGPIFLGISNLSNGRLDLSDTAHLSEDDFKKWTRRVTPRPGDLVFSYETRIGEAALIPEGLRCCLGRRMGLLRPDNSKIDSRFLLYAYLGPEFQATIQMRKVSGSTVERILLTELPDFPIRIPPLAIQRRIAGILGALDDKIEVNRRINRTLEEMAQTLYKHWFAGFGPFQAGEFVDSELGAVPAGWRTAKLKEIAKINPDSISKGNEPIHINYVNISSVDPSVIREVEPMPYSEAPSRAKRIVQHGDTIWSMVRPNRKSYCLIQNPIENLIVSTGFAVVRPKKVPYSFLYLALTTDSFVDYLTKRATGAAYPAVNTGDFKQAEVLVPPQQIAEQFEAIVRPWFSLQDRLQRENRKLAEIRDYLLPKLLSGEVEVPAAEAVVEGRPAGSEGAEEFVQPALL